MRSYTDQRQRQRAARSHGCAASHLGPAAPSVLRQEPGFDYMTSDGRRDCQENNVLACKRGLTALSWTAGKMMFTEQDEENALAFKIKVVVLCHWEPRASQRARLG